VEQQTPVVRRSSREIHQPKIYIPPDYHSSFALTAIEGDPMSVKEAINSSEGELWKQAMEEEVESLQKNDTWDLIKLPKGRKLVSSKWVFKKKMEATGEVEKYKARLVVKGYSQVEGVEFGEIFSSIAKLYSIRVLMSLAASFNLEVEQMEVKTIFLHGDLDEEIYMKQPEALVEKHK